jgi:hypothetical protein
MEEYGRGNCFNVTEKEEERRRERKIGRENKRVEKAIMEKVAKVSLNGSLRLILVEDLELKAYSRSNVLHS